MVTSLEADYLVPNSEFLKTVIERTVVSSSVQAHAKQCSVSETREGIPSITLREGYPFPGRPQSWITTGFEARSVSRYVLVDMRTLTGVLETEDFSTFSEHAWGLVIDTERNLVYVYDSRYRRNVARVIKIVKNMLYRMIEWKGASRFQRVNCDKKLLSRILRHLRSARAVDFTFNELQIGGTCTRWSRLFTTKIMSGEYDENLDRCQMMADRLALDAEILSS